MSEYTRRSTLSLAIATGQKYRLSNGCPEFLESHFMYGAISCPNSSVQYISERLGLTEQLLGDGIQLQFYREVAYTELIERKAVALFLGNQQLLLLDVMHVFLTICLAASFSEFLERSGIDAKDFVFEFYHLTGHAEIFEMANRLGPSI